PPASAQVDRLHQQPWLGMATLGVHADQRNARIFLASALDPGWLTQCRPEMLHQEQTLEWDPRSEALVAERQQRIGTLVLRREPLADIDPAQRSRALCNVVRKQGLALLPWTPALRQWQARVLLLRQLDMAQGTDSAWPDVSDQALLDGLEDWLAPWLDRVSR